MIKRFCKWIVRLWNRIFKRKIKAIRPEGSSSKTVQMTNGIEPLYSSTYRSIRHNNIVNVQSLDVSAMKDVYYDQAAGTMKIKEVRDGN